MRTRRRTAGESDPRTVLDHAVAVLEEYRRSGEETVTVTAVLALLKGARAPQPEPPRDPRADPMTGALWAGPAGTSPPA